MSGNFRRFFLLSSTLVMLFWVAVGISRAQSAFIVTLTAPELSDFPHLTAYLDMHDPVGAFMHGLSPQDVSLLENENLISADTLQELKPGAQFVIAITPGDTFATRDGQGITRYEYLLQGMLDGTWADQAPGVDDLSLLTLGGPQLIHSSDPSSLRDSLEAYIPDAANAVPNLEVLAAALQVASDPLSRPGMERAILFITPPQPVEASLGLQSIISSANQQGIRIHVWLVAARDAFVLPAADQLRSLADQTHGSFFAFSYDEPVPDLEALLDPLRYIYQLGYTSKAAAGSHQVSAQVMMDGQQISSLPQTFTLDLQPPSPTLVDLPLEIERVFTAQATPGAANLETDLVPNQQVILLDVAFPDGIDRPLALTSLYIDGALYAENTAPPFDQFIWDLTSYIQDGAHTLSVVAVDELGMSGNSTEISVTITVPSTTQGVMLAFSQKRYLLVGVVVLLSASILVLVLIVGGRIRPRPHPGQVMVAPGSKDKTIPSSYRARLRQQKDPVTQPVKIASHQPVQSKLPSKTWLMHLPWFKHKEKTQPAIAFLIPLADPGEVTLPSVLNILSDDASIGRDPIRANLVIHDPSIEAIHARIHHEGNSFLITDAGSVAGTWVNYDRVLPGGTPLAHADIIHLGQVGFRFNLAEPGPPRQVVVTTLEPRQ